VGAASVGALALGTETTATVAAGAPPPSGGLIQEAPARWLDDTGGLTMSTWFLDGKGYEKNYL
jgi:hypothetical protein